MPGWDELSEGFGKTRDPFPIPSNRFFKRQKIDAQRRRKQKAETLDKRRMRRMINPKNAAAVVAELPDPGDSLHAILKGDFVLCDLIGAILETQKATAPLYCATLSLSEANAVSLAGWIDDGTIPGLVLVLSHYFAGVNKTGIWATIEPKLKRAEVKIRRSHSKIIALETDVGSWAIESSANLRASGSIEQLSIFNDPEHLQFHRDWIDSL